MPVTIACPKCKTKYKIPDSALGKQLKCKSCGTAFRTKGPGQPPTGSAQPAAPSKPQTSDQELAKLGIDGPLKRQADIFAGTAPPPPQMGNPLGNFVVDDPGFADLNVVAKEMEIESDDGDGMSAILENPYAKKAKSARKKQVDEVDFSGYGVARVGMWIVFGSWIVMLGLLVFLYAFSWIGRLAPGFVQSMVETIGPTFFGILAVAIPILTLFALAMVFLGQILCIFSPNKDEKLFAGLAVGSMVGAVILPIVGIFMGAFAAGVSGDGAGGDAAKAAVGLLLLIVIVLAYILVLANMFFFITYFRRVGKNLNAKPVVESAKIAMLTWIAAIVAAILCSIAAFVLVLMFAPSPGEAPPEWLPNVISIIGLVNAILAFSVMGTLIAMVKSALAKTQSK